MTHESRRRAAIATLMGGSTTVAITLAQAFILIPLCLSYLGTRLYGAWLGASEILVWIQLLDAGIPNLLTQRVGAALGRGDRSTAAGWSATSFALLAAIGGTLAAIGLLAAPFVARWAQVNGSESPVFIRCFQIGVIASAVLLGFNGIVGFSRGAQRTDIVNAAQVLGTLAGLVVSVVLILAGWRLWSLAFGMLARAVVSLLGGLSFFLVTDRAEWAGRPSKAIAGEIGDLAPSMIASSIGYVLANNSEIVLVTTILGPVPAAVYALTRRSIDGLRSLLDSIAWAVYGGFAHLVTAGDRHRARPILHEMLWLRLALACLFGAVAVAVNRPFVSLLFGRAQFGGVWLTAALAAQMIAGGQAFLANCLLRAAGAVKEGSWLVAAEAALRVLAMAIGIHLFGLIGAPAFAVIVSVAALFINLRELLRRLPLPVAQALAGRLEHQFAPLAVFAFGLAAGLWLMPMSWTMAAATGTLVGGCGAGLLWCALPSGGAEGSSLLRFRWNRS